MIVCIVGGPRSGKTTLAERMALTSGTELLSTDDLAHLGWSEASAEVATRIAAARGDLIVEGVAVARALRKVLEMAPGKPCDRLIVLRPLAARLTMQSYLAALDRDRSIVLTDKQHAMAKGINTVLAGILVELMRRGVEVEAL